METMPRAEHPFPQFVREDWTNLNGTWDFAFDFNCSGLERGFGKSTEFPDKILVPFCPESKLSGIGYTDFIPAVWYHRTINITSEQLKGKVYLHFGAVDFESAHDTNFLSVTFYRVSERDSVDYRGEHAHIIALGAVQPLCGHRRSAEYVASTDNDDDFLSRVRKGDDFFGKGMEKLDIDTVARGTLESLSGKFEKEALSVLDLHGKWEETK